MYWWQDPAVLTVEDRAITQAKGGLGADEWLASIRALDECAVFSVVESEMGMYRKITFLERLGEDEHVYTLRRSHRDAVAHRCYHTLHYTKCRGK